MTSGDTIHLQLMCNLRGEHRFGVHALDWNPVNHCHLVTGGYDKQAVVYDLCKGLHL